MHTFDWSQLLQGNVRFDKNGTRIYNAVKVLQYQREGMHVQYTFHNNYYTRTADTVCWPSVVAMQIELHVNLASF